jgi:hypothetical protein
VVLQGASDFWFVVQSIAATGGRLAGRAECSQSSFDADVEDCVPSLRWLTFICAALALGVMVTPNTLASQTVRGVVVDDSTQGPLSGAVVTLLKGATPVPGRSPVRTDSLGRFTLHVGEMGGYSVRINRIGYEQLTSPVVNFAYGGQVHTLTLAMSVVPARLGSVVVSGITRYTNSELMTHVGFELRRSRGVGKFADSLDMVEFKRQPVSFLLDNNRARFGLITKLWPSGGEDILMLRGAGTCEPEVWVDGFQVPGWPGMGTAPRLWGVSADQVLGIEIYTGPQLPPISIAGEIGWPSALARPGSRCGAVAVWTKAWARKVQAEADAKARKNGGQ